MEFILVNSVKLKIILSDADMKELALCGEDIDYDLPSTRAAFRIILERAKKQTGFDIGHDRVYINVFPSLDGGCEIFLTRRGKLLPDPEEAEKGFLKKKYRLSCSKRQCYEYIAATKCFDDLADLCLRMQKDNFDGSSEVYLFDGIYYLVLHFGKRLPRFKQVENGAVKDTFSDSEECFRFGYLSDYADVFYAEKAMLAMLGERGKPLAPDNAVETLAKAYTAVTTDKTT